MIAEGRQLDGREIELECEVRKSPPYRHRLVALHPSKTDDEDNEECDVAQHQESQR